MPSVKEDLGSIFESLRGFTELNDAFQIPHNYIEDAATVLVDQITENLDIPSKSQDQFIDWLDVYLGVELPIKVRAKGFDTKEFMLFKRRFKNLLTSLIRTLGVVKNRVDWLKPQEIINLVNIDIEELWETTHGTKVTQSSQLAKALAKLINIR